MSVTSDVKYWVNTVSKDHVSIGALGGFCQACHGKAAPLKKMKPGDWIVYYSPKESFGGKEPCQKFTAIGQIADSRIYQFDMGEGFIPFRRDVTYLNNIKELPIRLLLSELSFTKDRGPKWGAPFRFGLFTIPKEDFELIHQKMISKKRNLET